MQYALQGRSGGRLAAPFFMIAAVAAALFAPQARAQESGAATPWQTEKCARYTAAWDKTLAERGTHGLGAAFLERHAAFIAGGCTGTHDVCPRSPAELDLANIMIVHSMNAGMASTFAPFGCPK